MIRCLGVLGLGVVLLLGARGGRAGDASEELLQRLSRLRNRAEECAQRIGALEQAADELESLRGQPPTDPNGMPGQVIVAGTHPGYLKYNGGGPLFLSGPDNPEDFLFRGTLNPDGTRFGGKQEEMISKMSMAGVKRRTIEPRFSRGGFRAVPTRGGRNVDSGRAWPTGC